MNVPVSPPVDLTNLKELAAMPTGDVEKQLTKAMVVRKKSRKKPLAALGLGVLAATGVLAWRALSAETGRASRARRNGILLAAGGALAAAGVFRWQMQRLFTPTPPYLTELHDGSFEVRSYPTMQVATTRVDASWRTALDLGFERLAGFIFGGNDMNRKLAMTTPVLGTGDDLGYSVAFVLPKNTAIPTPNDERVTFEDLPARRIAALRFHGVYSTENLEEHKVLLARALAERGLHPKGEAMFAGYDPPWTLPLLRRTELWVELA